MAKFILATKEHMTQFFDEDGKAYPATLLKAGPVVVTLVRTKEKDGYGAMQVAFGTKRAKNINKPLTGHFKGKGMFRYVKEFRPKDEVVEAKEGDSIDVSQFEKGDVVMVSGVSKSKGFQGVVKRHGFAGGPRTHGQKHSEREPGAIGGGARAGGRVAKGMRMAGRMGGDRITVKNLKVLAVDKENSQMLLSGSIPGKRGTLIEVRSIQ